MFKERTQSPTINKKHAVLSRDYGLSILGKLSLEDVLSHYGIRAIYLQDKETKCCQKYPNVNNYFMSYFFYLFCEILRKLLSTGFCLTQPQPSEAADKISLSLALSL